jgi:hypothetical protein
MFTVRFAKEFFEYFMATFMILCYTARIETIRDGERFTCFFRACGSVPAVLCRPSFHTAFAGKDILEQ